MIDILLNAGADVSGKGCPTTPLHVAARDGNEATVQALLRHGADPHAVDEDGKTPLDEAKADKHHQVMTILRKAMDLPSPTNPLAQLESLARDLGREAAETAIESNDYDHYVEEGLDVDDLQDDYWADGGYRDNILEAIGALAPKVRKKLGDHDKLLDKLQELFSEAYDAPIETR